jgi:integrase
MVKGYITSKNDHWYVVIYEGLDPATGKERRRWHPAGTDRIVAEALAERLRAEAGTQDGRRSRLTLAGHVKRSWLPRKARQRRPVTLAGYRRQLRLYILPELGPVPLRSLRGEQIEDLYEHLLTEGRADGTGGLSTKSVLEVHVLLRQILNDAVTRGLLAANPVRHAVPPPHRRDQHRRRMVWTAGELSTFLTGAVGNRHHDTYWLAAHTGMRRSELVGLRWRGIELDRRRLSISRTIVAVNGRMQPSNGKTAYAARTIDLDERTVGVLRRWHQDDVERFGSDDPDRDVLYIGQASLMTPGGSLPLNFEIEASSLREAVEKFGDLAQEAVQDAIQQLQEMRRDQASSLVIPGQGGQGGGGGMPGGGMPGGGGGIQLR